jgi:hypothetical protein
MSFAAGLTRIDVGDSGVVDLDLRWHAPASVLFGGCGFLRRLILSHRFRGWLFARYNASLASVTFGVSLGHTREHWLSGVRPLAVRFTSLVGRVEAAAASALRRATVLAEVGSLSNRECFPALPC